MNTSQEKYVTTTSYTSDLDRRWRVLRWVLLAAMVALGVAVFV